MIFRLLALMVLLCLHQQALAQIQRSIINPSFELPFIGPRATALNQFFTSTNWIYVDESEVQGWVTSHSFVPDVNNPGSTGCPDGGNLTAPYGCRPIELWANGFLGVTPANGRVLAELNAQENAKLFQNICMYAGESFSFNFAHRGRDGRDRARLEIGGANTIVLDFSTNTSGGGTIIAGGGATGTSVTDIGVWARYAGNYTYTGATGVQPLGFAAVSSFGAISTGNLLDDINIVLKPVIEFVGGTATSSIEGGATAAPRIKVMGVVPAGGLVLTLAVGGSATFGIDFNYSGATTLAGVTGTAASLSVTVPPGNYSDELANNVFTLPINVLNDTAIEDNETIVFTMPANGVTSNFINANTTNCGGAFSRTLTHTIVDNDIDLRATKAVNPTGNQTVGSTVTYTLGYSNVTPAILTRAPLNAHDANTVTIADMPPTGVSFGAWTCSAVGTTCPAVSGTGAISQTVNLPVGASLTYTLQATLTARSNCTQTVTNTSSIAAVATSPSGAALTEGASVQGNSSYVFQPNSASASNTVLACAALSISKTNNTSTLVAGQTTTYNVTVTNDGPASANNAALKDPVAAGLSCTSISCVATTGGASCASLGTVNIALLQSTGIALSNFPAASSYSFQVTCGVTASGQ